MNANNSQVRGPIGSVDESNIHNSSAARCTSYKFFFAGDRDCKRALIFHQLNHHHNISLYR